MSMQKHTLHDFIETVSSCVQTARISSVLEIFSQGQCDRLVVVNEQQCPIGVLNLRRLMPQIINSYGCKVSLDVQQPLCVLGLAFVEPIVTLPVDLSVEQFRLYLRSQQLQTNTACDWVLVDGAGKFLGLLDTARLLQFLAISPPAAMSTEEGRQTLSDKTVLDSLVQLLERLPWPLILQTGTGEVVMQNAAWCQQFESLSDPKAVSREVEAILGTPFVSQAKSRSQLHASVPEPASKAGHPASGDWRPLSQTGVQESEVARLGLIDRSEYPIKLVNPPQQKSEYAINSSTLICRPPQILSPSPPPLDDSASSVSGCQLGTQPGTCICTWPVQNGQERVWQFVKIPLQESVIAEMGSDLWLLMATDVTEQQQLASELAAKNADLIQLNRLKDEFLSCISHELKTPITAILGLSTLLKDRALGQLNERQARYAQLIHQSGRHLMLVVNDIFDLTRMETGQLKLTLEPVQIRTVCDRAIEQARTIQTKTSQPSAGEPLAELPLDHRFTLLIEPDLDSLVADELRLRQMLVNLLSNAFKFTEVGGEIGLRVSRWEGWIAFTVWDTGIGIPEQKQHLIFQKFQQLENPLTRKFEGTGLGLVLTRALARLHGGDVSFFSREGKGSQFTLLLPPSSPQRGVENEECTDTHPYTPVPTHQNRLVLVVEAAPRFIENLTEQLTGLGYRVVIARSGTEALEKTRRLQPAVVFLNPLLPLLSGWDVLTLLKSDTTTCQIPTIVTATRAEKEQAFSNRADEFLSLPVQQQPLQHLLASFCPIVTVSDSCRGVAPSADTDMPLTILRLVTPHSDARRIGLAPLSLLSQRLLEADDLEQAELLARVWQPHVILLDEAIPDPLSYLKQLSQHPKLAALPLVTQDAATTEVANQVTGLCVFPCLIPAKNLNADALLQVLKTAAGIN